MENDSEANYWLDSHPTLQNFKASLQQIHNAVLDYQPATDHLPILDSSLDGEEGGKFAQNGQLTGLGRLRDAVKMDLDKLDKFLRDPLASHLPPLSTNAPYLIAVWKELLCAPPPVEAIFKSIPLRGPAAKVRHKGARRPALAKVDIVADGGKRWIRVNPIKNSRLLAEFREMDSYLTGSDDESSRENLPTPVPMEFDNSVLRSGRSLLEAAKANCNGGGEVPRVTLCLIRLNPFGEDTDPRIGKTIRLLQEMGITVELGERPELEMHPQTPSPATSLPLEPTLNISLDLSAVIAVIADSAHAPLPHSLEEAKKRYIPPTEYLEWRRRKNQNSQDPSTTTTTTTHLDEYEDIDDLPDDLRKHALLLTNQLLREMKRGLLQEMRDRISALTSKELQAGVKFWTTSEVRDRTLQIVAKIGGTTEKRRAHALFSPPSSLSSDAVSEAFWRHSRHPSGFLPLVPVNIFPPSSLQLSHLKLPSSTFSRNLMKTCREILGRDLVPRRPVLSGDPVLSDTQHGIMTKALATHTVQTVLRGAELGWTTMTTNRMSIKAILRHMKSMGMTAQSDGAVSAGGAEQEDLEVCQSMDDRRTAAIWFVDHRSLAEGMSRLSHVP